MRIPRAPSLLPRAEHDALLTQHAHTSRKRIEKAILNKIKEQHAIKERLHTLRFDPTQPPEDTQRDVEVRTRT